MRTSEILIEGDNFGVARSVEVAMDRPIFSLVPELVEKLYLPQTDLFGNPLVYTLRHAISGRILPSDKTLTAVGILSGMRLTLDSSITEGITVPFVPLAATTSESVVPQVYVSPPPSGLRDINLHTSDTLADAALFPAFAHEMSAGYAPVPKKRSGVSRRTFLATFGVLCGISGVGVGYAAYRGLMNEKNVPTHVALQKNQAHVEPPKVLPVGFKLRFTFTQHQQTVRSVMWSPSGTVLASAADDGRVLIWDTKGIVQRALHLVGSVRGVAWSPDSKRLVAGSNTQISFWDVLTGQRLALSAHRHTQMVTGLAWTAQNAQQVVSVGDDTHAIIWDTQHYRSQLIYREHTAAIAAVAWGADGKIVATASQGGIVRVWAAATGKDIHGYYQDAHVPMRAVAFSSDGVQLAVGGDDGVVRIWHGLTCVNNGAQCQDVPQRIVINKTPIRAVSWSPDARFFAVGTNDGMLVLFQTGKVLKQLAIQKVVGTIHSMTWSPDSKQLATAVGTQALVWDVR